MDAEPHTPSSAALAAPLFKASPTTPGVLAPARRDFWIAWTEMRIVAIVAVALRQRDRSKHRTALEGPWTAFGFSRLFAPSKGAAWAGKSRGVRV
jgi:hypothetical protein